MHSLKFSEKIAKILESYPNRDYFVYSSLDLNVILLSLRRYIPSILSSVAWLCRALQVG